MNKKYIYQIIRKLKCSGKKRREIKHQMISEMEESISEGSYGMGDPVEIAEEFNRSFSEEEKRAYRRERRLKIAAVIVLILLVAASILWWMMPKQIWLEDSKIFDKTKVQEQAEIVIGYLDDDNYLALQQLSDDKMSTLLENDDLKKAKTIIGETWGAQKSVGNVYMVELTHRGKKSAIVQMHMEYEKVNVMYTIYFNEHMELEGLWMQ